MIKTDVKKICLWVALIYLAAVFVFYFAAGEQLFIRDSKKNIAFEANAADLATGELLKDEMVSQVFLCEMDQIESVSVRLATFGRENIGQLLVRLRDVQTQQLLAEWTLEMDSLEDSVYTRLTVPETISQARGRFMTLEIISVTGVRGNAVAPWYNVQLSRPDWQLYFNGEPVPGVLNFEMTGKDLVWTGPRYWKIVSIGGACLWIGLLLLYRSWKKENGNPLLDCIAAMSKYRFLMEQLVSRDFKTKYKRSVLGVFWSFLNPLLTMVVQYMVFSTIFKADVKNYPVYLLVGIVLFGFFSEATNMSLMSIVGNAPLITKVYVPKFIYPLTRVLSSSVNLVISLLPLLVMILFTRTAITKAYLLLLFPIGCLIAFCIGMALLLSSSMVFFRDTQFLWSVFSLLWMYATPIFYPEKILPASFSIVHKINPMYHFIKFARIIIIDGISPEPRMYLLCAVIALAFLLVGCLVFQKAQDQFVFYI